MIILQIAIAAKVWILEMRSLTCFIFISDNPVLPGLFIENRSG